MLKNLLSLILLIVLVGCRILYAGSGDPNWVEVGEGEWPIGVKPHPASAALPIGPEWSVVNPLPFDPNWIEPVAKLIDPNFFSIYKQYEKKDYLKLITDEWLHYNPIQVSRIPIGGRKSWRYFRLEHPADIGNCAFWDRVDLYSFAVYAKNYQGGILFPSEQKKTTTFEMMIKYMGLLFIEKK